MYKRVYEERYAYKGEISIKAIIKALVSHKLAALL